MSASSLRNIEKTMTQLWMRRDLRDKFLNDESTDVDPAIAAQIDRSGVELYASLLNYGHHDVMISIYPLSAKLLGSQWHGLVDQYLTTFPPDHFNLNRAAKRFSSFVEHECPKLSKRFPYLSELADYEWLEMELLENNQEAPVSDLSTLDSPEQFAQFAPIINPALAIRRYRYPIIKIAEQLEGSKRHPRNVSPVETRAACYRDPVEQRCRFMELGDAAAAILETAQRCPTPYTELIALALSHSPGADPQAVVLDFLNMIESLQANRMCLGNQKVA